MSRSSNSIKNASSGLLSKFIAMPLQFIIRMLLLNRLGADFLGLNSFYASIINIINISELGIGSAMVYMMYKPIAENDNKRLGAILNLYRRIYAGIGTIVLAIGLIMIPFLPMLSHNTCPKGINLYIGYLIYLLDTVVSYFCYAYKLAMVSAYQKRYITTNSYIVTHTCMCLLQIVVLLTIKNYYVFIALIPLFTILKAVSVHIYSNKVLTKVKCCGNIAKSERMGLYRNVGALIGHKMGDVIINSADNIVVSSILGLSALGIFNNYNYIISSLSSLVDVVALSLLGSIGNSIASETKEKNYRTFLNLSFASGIIVGWCAIILFALFQNFMYMWVGPENMYSSQGTIILFVVYFYVTKIRIIILDFKDAAGLWRSDKIKPYIGIVLDIFMNIVLVVTMGINGVLISTILIMCVLYIPWETKVIFDGIFKCRSTEYIALNIRLIFSTVISFILVLIMTSFIRNMEIGAFIVRIVISFIMPGLVYGLMFRKTTEFKYFFERIKNLIHKLVK